MAIGIDRYGRLTACPSTLDSMRYNDYLLNKNREPLSTMGLPAGAASMHYSAVSAVIEREQLSERQAARVRNLSKVCTD
ncbi:MAG TPA: hypothetical protein VHA12_00995 [Candidatus Nanoarchaeia archaeon]|nr:hypothetical protein [Candidatus Nanoarchaeia archaeon]